MGLLIFIVVGQITKMVLVILRMNSGWVIMFIFAMTTIEILNLNGDILLSSISNKQHAI